MASLSAAELRRRYAAGERDFAALALPGAELTRVNLADASLAGADLSEANLTGAVLVRADLSGANLAESTSTLADAAWANLSGARLHGARLAGAILQDANLRGADLADADLSGANLAMANLVGANLRSAVLAGANLSGANLTDADLTWADLKGANFSRAELPGVHLMGANLSRATLDRASLRRANLKEADLNGASLIGADLTEANFTDARLSGAILAGAQLTGARALHLDRNVVRDAVFSVWPGDSWTRLRRSYTGGRTAAHLALLCVLLLPGLRMAMGGHAPSEGGVAAPLWRVVLGADGDSWQWAAPVALLVYNLLRLAFTAWVSLLADAENRSGVTPPLSTHRIPGRVHAYFMQPLFLVAAASLLARFAEFLRTPVLRP